MCQFVMAPLVLVASSFLAIVLGQTLDASVLVRSETSNLTYPATTPTTSAKVVSPKAFSAGFDIVSSSTAVYGVSSPSPLPTNRKNAKFFKKPSSTKRRKAVDVSSIPIGDDTTEWRCPNVTASRSLECGCDLPHTLRCNGDLHGLTVLSDNLRSSPYSVALLDVSLRNVTFLSDARIFDHVSLRCLIISSGEIKRVHKSAFLGIEGPLLALGLPGNALLAVPWSSLSTLVDLERLDLSNNKIKALGTSDLAALVNLEYLDMSNNQLSSISQRTFANLRRLEVLKLGGNRLGDYASSLKALMQCHNLRDLDLSANNLSGNLSASSIPVLKNLASLNLNRNLIKSIQNKALMNFSRLTTLSLQHNQIDVLQDHAFYGLGSLETLDLSYNGIVAISSASLQHLTRLKTLDLTHNFLRALTSDLIKPLPSLVELRLSGNDISIVAKHALDGARELKTLVMEENPLSCDCTIREFAEWLQAAKLVSQDLLKITCVTPPKLEGAPLIQVPMEMLSCGDMENLEEDNANIIEQLEAMAKQNHSTNHHIKDLSEEIILHELHFSADYGLILTWIINLSKNDYMCDAIFVYKEENINEILIDNSPIHCESKMINGQNTVSVIVPDSSSLDVGESYRFCLVMVQEHNEQSDLTVGCSNITQLQVSNSGMLPQNRQFVARRPYADLSKFDRSATPDLVLEQSSTNGLNVDYSINSRKFNTLTSSQQRTGEGGLDDGPHTTHAENPYEFLNSLNKSFLPGLGLGILVTSIMVLIWAASRLRQNVNHNNNNNNNIMHGDRRSSSPTATTCYAASEHLARLADTENGGTRYLKLQATTSL
ncbi:leucine-rich repeat neuronal protein 1 [Musca domestica]|uniref:Leucine-rich repeat neuronal protein 1 n=1 Tax=Musca domestica TaxID=7370 RepID=A0A1I8MN34_MUSDO|nr:leucine-rich repeat neuronal protein 1 [Musca domestica]